MKVLGLMNKYKKFWLEFTLLGANLFKDIFQGIRDIVGMYSRVHERILKDTRTTEFGEMEKKRQKINVQRHTCH